MLNITTSKQSSIIGATSTQRHTMILILVLQMMSKLPSKQPSNLPRSLYTFNQAAHRTGAPSIRATMKAVASQQIADASEKRFIARRPAGALHLARDATVGAPVELADSFVRVLQSHANVESFSESAMQICVEAVEHSRLLTLSTAMTMAGTKVDAAMWICRKTYHPKLY